jgi:hypothetical protein
MLQPSKTAPTTTSSAQETSEESQTSSAASPQSNRNDIYLDDQVDPSKPTISSLNIKIDIICTEHEKLGANARCLTSTFRAFMFSKFIDVQAVVNTGNEGYFARDVTPQVDQAEAFRSEELDTLREVKLINAFYHGLLTNRDTGSFKAPSILYTSAKHTAIGFSEQRFAPRISFIA